MLETLLDTLASAGKPAEVCEMPEGSRVVLLPHGGRVLGVVTEGYNTKRTRITLGSADCDVRPQLSFVNPRKW